MLGYFPDKLKIAKIRPLYKNNDPSSFSNYRPISLLSVNSKIFKNVIHKQLLNYFTSNNMLSHCQYGFRLKHSTEHAALQLHDYIIRQLDINKTPFSICIDLSQAFDTIDHTILIKIMKYYGIEHESCNSPMINFRPFVIFNLH